MNLVFTHYLLSLSILVSVNALVDCETGVAKAGDDNVGFRWHC